MALLIHHISRTVAALDQEIALGVLVLCLGLDTYLVITGSGFGLFLRGFLDKWIVENWALYCCK